MPIPVAAETISKLSIPSECWYEITEVVNAVRRGTNLTDEQGITP